jgi:hypothetical protein
VQESLLVLLVRREYVVRVKLLDLLGCLGVSSDAMVDIMYIEMVRVSNDVVDELTRFGTDTFTFLRVFITLVVSYTWTAIAGSIESRK